MTTTPPPPCIGCDCGARWEAVPRDIGQVEACEFCEALGRRCAEHEVCGRIGLAWRISHHPACAYTKMVERIDRAETN